MKNDNFNSELEILETGLDAIDHIILNQRSMNLALYIEESKVDLQKACRLAGINFEPIALEEDRLEFDKQFHLEMFKFIQLLQHPHKNHLEILKAYYDLRYTSYSAQYWIKPLNTYDFVIYDKLNVIGKDTIDNFNDYCKSLILKNDLNSIKKKLLEAILRTKHYATAPAV